MKTQWKYDKIKVSGKFAFQQWVCNGCEKRCTKLMGLNDDAPPEEECNGTKRT